MEIKRRSRFHYQARLEGGHGKWSSGNGGHRERVRERSETSERRKGGVRDGEHEECCVGLCVCSERGTDDVL